MFGERKYYEDYVVEVVEKNGKPKKRSTYIGDIFEYVSPRLAARLKLFLAVGGSFMAALFIAAGVLTFSENEYYVLVPFAAELLTLAIFIFAVVELFIYGGTVRSGDKRRTVDRIRPVTIAHAVISAVCVIGAACFAIFDSTSDGLLTELAFIACNMMSAGTAFFCSLAARDLKMHETVNPEKDRIARQRAEQIEVNKMLEKEKRQRASAAAEDYRNKKNKNK